MACRSLTLERGGSGGGQAAAAPLLLALQLHGRRSPASMTRRQLACGECMQARLHMLSHLLWTPPRGRKARPRNTFVRTMGDESSGRSAGRRGRPARHLRLAHHRAGSCASGGHAANWL